MVPHDQYGKLMETMSDLAAKVSDLIVTVNTQSNVIARLQNAYQNLIAKKSEEWEPVTDKATYLAEAAVFLDYYKSTVFPESVVQLRFLLEYR